MEFLQYKGSKDWWKWPEGGLTVFNVVGGWHDIDENSPAFMDGTVIRADSWADLCKKTGYNPWQTDDNQPTREMWIDTYGTMYDCGEWGAHEATAQTILEVLYNEPEEYWDAGDKLVERGWVKVSAGPMNRYYHESDMYSAMTNAQYNSYVKWKGKYGVK